MLQSAQLPPADGTGILELAMLGVLLFTLLLAKYHDKTRRRIPNMLVLVALVSAMSMHSLNAGSAGLVTAITGGAVGLVLFLPFYLMRAMGAGDVKLMVSVGSLLGPAAALLACGLTLIAGAVIALGFFAHGRMLIQEFPHALAIAVGFIAAVTAVHW